MLKGFVGDPFQLFSIPGIEWKRHETGADLGDAEVAEPAPNSDPRCGGLPWQRVGQQDPLDRSFVRNHGCILPGPSAGDGPQLGPEQLRQVTVVSLRLLAFDSSSRSITSPTRSSDHIS
jgi:hypothetical protein